MVFWQVGMQKVTGRMFCLEERSREWAWPGCSTTSETFNVLFKQQNVAQNPFDTLGETAILLFNIETYSLQSAT